MTHCDGHFSGSGEALGHQGATWNLQDLCASSRLVRLHSAGRGFGMPFIIKVNSAGMLLLCVSNHQVVMHGCRAAVLATLCRRTPYIFSRNRHPYFVKLEKANRLHLSVRRIAGAQMKHFSGALWAASERVLATCETPTRFRASGLGNLAANTLTPRRR